MSGVKTTAYARRFEKIFEYIDQHLGEPLSVEQISRVANSSKFHFHRQFSQYTGVGVISYIHLFRPIQASCRLVFHKHERVIEVAIDAGSGSPEAFCG